MGKYVYPFNKGNKTMAGLLGIKGANLAEMTRVGLPVPFGFTITADAVSQFNKNGQTISDELEAEIFSNIKLIEEVTGRKLGDAGNPLLLAVRTGDVVSSGIMTTVPGIETEEEYYKHILKLRAGRTLHDTVLNVGAGEDPRAELLKCISEAATFGAANDARGEDAQDKAGIAVIVQAMVSGMLNERSGGGIAFTRNPVTGDKKPFIEFRQKTSDGYIILDAAGFAAKFPHIFFNLERIAALLESYYKDMQRMEFVIEDDKLYMLHTEPGVRNIRAAVKIAVDLKKEGLIDADEALMRVDAEALEDVQGNEELDELLSWADDRRELKVRANAGDIDGVKKALEAGADGIGIIRCDSFESAEELAKVFESADDKPVAIRLADCRKAVVDASFVEEQVRRIIEAAMLAEVESLTPTIEIMVPIAGAPNEIKNLRRIITKTASEKAAEISARCDDREDGKEDRAAQVPEYRIGAMIETPRAALACGEIARESDFLSFSADDLTRMMFGFSGGNYRKLIKEYVESGMLENDPFSKLDRGGVGRLIELAMNRSRQIPEVRQAGPGFKAGIVGNQAVDTETMKFCTDTGLDYISCSPALVKRARLIAAQAIIKGN